jgi:hypothetical protein
MKAHSPVFNAYNDLYELSLVRPHRTVAFRGFDKSELRATDATMIPLEGTNMLPARVDATLKR